LAAEIHHVVVAFRAPAESGCSTLYLPPFRVAPGRRSALDPGDIARTIVGLAKPPDSAPAAERVGPGAVANAMPSLGPVRPAGRLKAETIFRQGAAFLLFKQN
jgi:hypothetical protein